MKLKLEEFKQQLKLLKGLPVGETRTAMLATLKSADVFEEKDGKEMRVLCEIGEDLPAAETKNLNQGNAVTGLADEKIVELVSKALDTRLAAFQKANPAMRNPVGYTPSKTAEGKMIIPATVKRVSVLKNFKRAEVNGYTAEERAYRFGMWGLACMGNENAKRFCEEQGINLVVDQKAAHAEGTNTLGGYLVPEEFGQDMIDLRLEYGVARRILRRVPMSSDTRTDPAASAV
jgi:HK97 family phage major capsid protein